MAHAQHYPCDDNLHAAAVAGDDEGARRALASGANVNSLDSLGRTALMCAVAGDEWETIDASSASFMTTKRLDVMRTLLAHPDISLLTLNLPHGLMNGVIPLGMAAWLNIPSAVRVLLKESSNCVSVDGMDSHGATALMYAARDGSLGVVQLLLSHGARPDFRDRNHRTSIQFALLHPQILWLCEAVLRRHRWRESENPERSKLWPSTDNILDLLNSALPSADNYVPPPPALFTAGAMARVTKTIISSIASNDVSFLYSLLFSPPLSPSSPSALYPLSAPILINLPDPEGWSPIHHCVAQHPPSIKILDALYCAGADVALFTTQEHFTPLHVLAQTAIPLRTPEEGQDVFDFVVHLIRDLRAPIAARDRDDETCIHIAAEHGSSLEVLAAFLAFDPTCSVREMRNSRGFTALEVAKAEFRSAFGEDAEKFRPSSSLSSHTIRPTESFSSLASFSGWDPSDAPTSSSRGASSHPTSAPKANLEFSSEIDVVSTSHRLVTILRATSPDLQHPCDTARIHELERQLEEMSQLGQMAVDHYRTQLDNAMKELQDLRLHAKIVNELHDIVCRAVSASLVARGLEPITMRGRESEDSQGTAVSHSSAAGALRIQQCLSASNLSAGGCEPFDDNHVSVGTQTIVLDFFDVRDLTDYDTSATQWPSWVDAFMRQAESSAHKALLGNLLDVEREIAQVKKKLAGFSSTAGPDPNVLARDVRYKQLEKKKRKIEEKIVKEMVMADKVASGKGKEASSTAASKFTTWLKKKIGPERRSRIDVVYALDEPCNVGREAKAEYLPQRRACDEDEEDDERPGFTPLRPPAIVIHSSERFDPVVDNALQTSRAVMRMAEHDLDSIHQCLASAENLINLAEHSLARCERVLKRATKKRETMLTNLRHAMMQKRTLSLKKSATTISKTTTTTGSMSRRKLHITLDGHAPPSSSSSSSNNNLNSPRYLSPTLAVPQITSQPSISSIASSISSAISVAATLTDKHDDEETRVMRRLLMRKLEAGIGGAWEEMERISNWLRVVKEVVRGVKRRTYV